MAGFIEVDVQKLKQARVNMHYALQVAASATALAEAEDDYSHTSFTFFPGQRYFKSRAIQKNLQLAFSPAGLEVILCDSEKEVARQQLAGLTMAEGLDWLAAALEKNSLKNNGLEMPGYDDFPDSDLARGATFESFVAEQRFLLENYGRAHQLISKINQGKEDASPVRLWPHHFDLASLVELGEDKSIGIGFSPGDQGYEAPYYYVTPWPYPDKEGLPALQAGQWHTEGWVGGVLQPTENEDQIEKFLIEAFEGASAALFDGN